MNNIDYGMVEELIQHTGLLLDNAKANLEDIKKAISDPMFLKSALKQKEFSLKRKMNEILRGQAELRNLTSE